jgi:hypothetical protein
VHHQVLARRHRADQDGRHLLPYAAQVDARTLTLEYLDHPRRHRVAHRPSPILRMKQAMPS